MFLRPRAFKGDSLVSTAGKARPTMSLTTRVDLDQLKARHDVFDVALAPFGRSCDPFGTAPIAAPWGFCAAQRRSARLRPSADRRQGPENMPHFQEIVPKVAMGKRSDNACRAALVPTRCRQRQRFGWRFGSQWRYLAPERAVMLQQIGPSARLVGDESPAQGTFWTPQANSIS